MLHTIQCRAKWREIYCCCLKELLELLMVLNSFFFTTGYENIERKEEGWIIMLKYHLKRNLLKVLKIHVVVS